MVWPWQRNRGPRRRSADPRVVAAPADRLATALADESFAAGLRPIPSGRSDAPALWSAADIVGVTHSGEPLAVELAGRSGRLLLAFLNTSCDGCGAFWEGIRHPENLGLHPDVSVIAITKGPDSLPSADVAVVAADIEDVPVVMSDQAWIDYRVLGYPFFVLVDAATRSVVGETVGFGWDDVISMTNPRN